MCIHRFDIVTWSKSRWLEESGTRHASKKTAAWMQADPDLEGILEDGIFQVRVCLHPCCSLLAGTTAAFGDHAQYRLHQFAITRPHFCTKEYEVLR